MSDANIPNSLPTNEELESLFVNNDSLQRIKAHINRFNPIKVMKMERMEIRHSAILGWLLNPSETHGLDDKFLKAFLAESLRGQQDRFDLSALDLLQDDLRDCDVRVEWNNIDIFVLNRRLNWAFIIENKVDSSQSKDQLKIYHDKIVKWFANDKKDGNDKKEMSVGGIFLILHDEGADHEKYAPISYDTVCVLLDDLLVRESNALSVELTVFLKHYLEIVRDLTGMNEKQAEMEQLARRLYIEHKKVLEFIVEHGTTTEFASAARDVFGENLNRFDKVDIGGSAFCFDQLYSNHISFLPAQWFAAVENQKDFWPGCEKWWAGYPVITWLGIKPTGKKAEAKLTLFAEIGPVSDHDKRRGFITAIKDAVNERSVDKITFQKKATSVEAKYSKFLKKNSITVKNYQDADDIAAAMQKLLGNFKTQFDLVADILKETSARQ